MHATPSSVCSRTPAPPLSSGRSSGSRSSPSRATDRSTGCWRAATSSWPLYVNHTPQNFSALRFTSLVHVYLAHGDSDKGVSISNQCKAYDFCFVAGQAAIDRLSDYLMFTDPASWCITIGRPQLDASPVVTPASGRPDRPTVLYAPTWEGAQPSLAYGSLASHGAEAGRRAHRQRRDFRSRIDRTPCRGSTDAAYGAADAAVRALISAAARARPRCRSPGRGGSAARGVLRGRRPAAVRRVRRRDGLASHRQAARDHRSGRAGGRHPCHPNAGGRPPAAPPPTWTESSTWWPTRSRPTRSRADRLALVDYYLGDTSPGAATQRFLEACTEVIQRRDEQRATVLTRGPAGP